MWALVVQILIVAKKMHNLLSFFGVVYNMKCSVAKGRVWAALAADRGIEVEMPKSRTSPQLSSLPITEFEPPGCQIRARGGCISWQRKRVC